MTTLRKIGLLFLLCFAAGGLKAQTVQALEDPLVHEMVNSWVIANRSGAGIDGWRVQVMASTDREQVERAKTQFLTLYPDIPADWTHEKPYYKLKVGAFRSRQEARGFIALIQDNFPGCYPARDQAIPPRDFLQMQF